ncbi:MAG: hypothetical protein CMM94_05290 [Rickettsiales bacterium]|nr:hypothetical protein [Rickettsiales bacterium]
MNDQFFNDDTIDYPGLIDNAMRNVVREALQQVADSGLPGDHHFFISFLTQFPGVEISPMLRERYPEEMTIVVQHQFWDLIIEDDYFTITLSFSNIPEKLVIPFASLTAFADPSIKFGLQFHARDASEFAPHHDEPVACPATGKKPNTPPPAASFDEEPPSDDHPPANDAKVLSMEAFRKK